MSYLELLILLLLSLTNVISGVDFNVRRLDEGDEFVWSNIEDCAQFSNNSAYSQFQKCHCLYGYTFSTETTFATRKCQQYRTRAHYRFSRNAIDDLPVSTVYLTCRENGICSFNLVKNNMEQPLATQSNDLTADTNCTINYVEIIHDCEPRRAPLELQIVPQDRKLYLKVKQSVENLETVVEGELFQVDITCNMHNTGKLLFKFNGSRTLNTEGSFDGIHIPAYDPSLYGCLQPTETPSPSFPNRQKPLPQSNMVINATHAEENHNSFPIIPVAAGGVFIVILVIVTLMIVLVIVIRRRCKRAGNAPDQLPIARGGGEEGGGY
ncbi:uncharacterized protein [Dysidea avara]|uniref:uncharacterized protein n=1 Tax=Dysidea avara TaxID=196820 RepID=UPI0033318D64